MAVIDSLDRSDYNCASSHRCRPCCMPSLRKLWFFTRRNANGTGPTRRMNCRCDCGKGGYALATLSPLFPDTSDDAIRNRWKRLTTEGDTEQNPRTTSSESSPRTRSVDRRRYHPHSAVSSNTLNSVPARHPRSSWRNRIHRLGLDEAYRECHKRYRSSTSLSWETTDALKDELERMQMVKHKRRQTSWTTPLYAAMNWSGMQTHLHAGRHDGSSPYHRRPRQDDESMRRRPFQRHGTRFVAGLVCGSPDE